MAIEIKKEKNLIYFQDTEKTKPYVLDINTMKFYGLSGKEILRNPISSRITRIIELKPRKELTYLDYVLKEMIYEFGSVTHKYSKYKEHIAVADTLTNLKLPYFHMYISDYPIVKKHIKEYTEYVARRQNDEDISIRTFLREIEYNAFLKKNNLTADDIDLDTYRNIKNQSLIMENISHYIYATQRAYLKEFCLITYGYCGYENRALETYYKECQALEKTPVKTNNLTREIVETHRQYELRKQEFDAKIMAQNYARHSKAFEFAYGDYMVVVPKAPIDIINEGRDMHHCVGSYVQDVVDNRTYIVFVRHKDTPDKCYLTAQVHTNGRLGQYYLAYDRRISSAEDIAFRDAFEQHLIENWNA